jgi:hypothetical protein
VYVKFIKKELVQIVAMVKQQKRHQLIHNNALELQKKEQDVRKEPPIQADGVTYINY